MGLKLELQVSDEDLAVLAHVVADPEAWVRHAADHVGAIAVRAKIEKYRADYLDEREKLGAAYRTRVQRDADDVAARESAKAAAAADTAGEDRAVPVQIPT